MFLCFALGYQKSHLTFLFSCTGEKEVKTLVLDVDGMKCGGCSAAVKRILMTNPGVQSASVNLLTECAVVQVDSDNSQSSLESLTQSLSSKVIKLSANLCH